MTTFIKAKLKKTDDQKNFDKYRKAANITKCHIISKLIFHEIIIPKFMKIWQLFLIKKCMFKLNVCSFWSQLSSCYALNRVTHCITHYCTEFEV